MNEKLQISIKSGKAYAHSLTEAVMTPNGDSIRSRYLYGPQLDALRQTLWPTNGQGWFGSNFGKGVNLLHFSDLHGDAVNLAKIVALQSIAPKPLDVLFTGDMLNYDWSNDSAFWDTAGAGPFMVAIGNHDSFKNGNWYGATAAECYARFISPFVSTWGVTSQANLCYYYKDWATKNVRLIVLDVMHWDTAQENWLVATLSSARVAGYHVVVAGHCVGGNTDSGTKSCPFDTIGANRSLWESESYGKMNPAVSASVQDFVDAGGHFVCYLCGHTHSDLFRHLAEYPAQLCVAVGDSGINAHVGSNAISQLERVVGEKSEELYNLVSINAIRQTITIIRVGADYDTIGRHIGSVVYDYVNHQILWND